MYIHLYITDSGHFHKHQKLDPEKANAETTDPKKGQSKMHSKTKKTNKVSKV